MGIKNGKRGRCIKRNQCYFSQGVLTLGDVRCNGAKQGLCTVIHMVCGFMRGQMVPLKQEVIDIMTWPTAEWGCMCVLYGCVRAIEELHFCLHVNTSSDSWWKANPSLISLIMHELLLRSQLVYISPCSGKSWALRYVNVFVWSAR